MIKGRGEVIRSEDIAFKFVCIEETKVKAAKEVSKSDRAIE